MTTDIKEPDILNDKRHKKQKNKRIRAIQEQMEFYFSDANLTKDKFLSKLLKDSDDNQIDLSVFFTFNKIKAFETSIEEIVSALSKSTLLKVSADGKHVKRVTSVKPNENVDKCTIYVENLPQTADHDWIREKFKPFGKVVYISLPIFKLSKKIKGFTFVEFENEDAVESACKAFTKVDSSVTEKQIETGDSKQPDAEGKKSQVVIAAEENSDATVEPPKKKRKTETTADVDLEGVSYLIGGSEKKSPKKKRKQVIKKSCEKVTPALRVLSKLEWKRYRNKYLKWQKANMAQLKKNLALHRESKKWANQDQEIEKQEKVIDRMPEFTPGCIIKLTFNDPVIKDAKQLRDEIKSLVGVRYVELKEAAACGFIRCDCTEITKSVLESIKEKGGAIILEGEEEKAYWDKIAEDRNTKLSNKQRPKRRGFDKITRRAVNLNMEKLATHVRFDD
ncbi:hypothetical protein CHUAL_000346 [Chamberlinius hualienensis]